MKIRAISLTFSLLLISACAPRTPDPDLQIRAAVAATLSAIPTPTRAPLATAFPSPTPFDLVGLFCEYQFCIGHPPEMAFFDVSAQQNPASPSNYTQGILATYSSNLFIQVMWQLSPGSKDSQFLLDLLLDDQADARVGTIDAKLIHDMNVLYTPITSTASALLPYGSAGSWNCGDRVFAWKVYTPDNTSGEALFNNAVNRFSCNKK
jgi:hypothetical protein